MKCIRARSCRLGLRTRWHRDYFESASADRRLQVAELDYVTRSRAAATTLAENYVGLAFE